MSPLDGWDLHRYREVLRQRGARLRRDPRILARFDESDLANETLLRAHAAGRVPAGLDDDAKRLAWLRVIQDNALCDMYRRQFADKRDLRRETHMETLRKALEESGIDQADLAVDPSDSPSEKAAQREEEQRADEAIDQLPSPQREIIRRKRQGLTLQQIADELKLSLSTVTGHYYRAMKKLKDQLGSG